MLSKAKDHIIKGIGVSLRFPHFDNILRKRHQIPWFEVIADDFLNEGPHHEKLLKLRENYSISFHSVGLNIGGVDHFNKNYLAGIKRQYEKFEPHWVSDHLCWSHHGGKYHHDLLPIPRTSQGLKNVCGRIHALQDYFKRQLLLENITSYLDYNDAEFSETDFIRQVIKNTDCALILDISNVVINHKNRNQNYWNYLEEYPMESVKYIHLAGGECKGRMMIDTHSTEVKEEDIDILKKIYRMRFQFPAIIERDSNLPLFEQFARERTEVEAATNGI